MMLRSLLWYFVVANVLSHIQTCKHTQSPTQIATRPPAQPPPPYVGYAVTRIFKIRARKTITEHYYLNKHMESNSPMRQVTVYAKGEVSGTDQLALSPVPIPRALSLPKTVFVLPTCKEPHWRHRAGGQGTWEYEPSHSKLRHK